MENKYKVAPFSEAVKKVGRLADIHFENGYIAEANGTILVAGNYVNAKWDGEGLCWILSPINGCWQYNRYPAGDLKL